ncbi:MAG TPA: hypothetical protein DGT21_24345 [Armatimonadetes bacterium]|nr:hypothetical protein [Armatimonadota bacterium]
MLARTAIMVLVSLCCAWSQTVCGAQQLDMALPHPAHVSPHTLLLVKPGADGSLQASAVGKATPLTQAGKPAPSRSGQGASFGPGEMLSYEAAGNIDLNHGTLELWIDENWTARQRTRPHYLVAHPGEWNRPGFIRLWYWAPSETFAMLRFDCHAIFPRGNGYILAPWPGRGRHHIAARWDCRDGIALYVDGVKVAELEGTWDELPPAEGVIEISHPEHATEAIIEAVRIRDIPLYAADEPVVRVAVGEAAGPTEQQPGTGTVPLQLANRRSAPFSGRLSVAVSDYFGNRVGGVDEPLRLQGYAEHEQAIEFSIERPSKYFRVHAQVLDDAGASHVGREYIVTAGSLVGPRKAVCLDGEWQYADGKWGDFTAPQGGWSTVLLPRKESKLPTHLRWYRRTFDLPPDVGARVRLVPTHIKQRARWWINGIEVGESEYAYVPYSFDITYAVHRDGRNEVLVAVLDWVESAQPELQAHLATTAPDSASAIEGKPLVKPSGGEVLPAGIIESVWVYGHGDVWLSDIAMVTSARERSIAVRGRVHNDGAAAVECQIGNGIFDGDTRALGLPETVLSVPPAGTAEFEVSAPWPDPHMWWPHDPHMYRLHSGLSIAGSETDVVDTRFGFREFQAEGGTFTLNDVPMHLFATSSWPNSVQMGWPGRIRDRWQETRTLFESVKESGHDIFRAHTEPWSSLLTDLCDEIGLLFVAEGIMSSIPGKYNWDRPETMDHFKRFCALWPQREMNNPSLVIRSIENEIGYLLQEKIMLKESIPRVHEGYVECGRIVKQADPSRLIMYEGSGPAFYDAADIYNNHYPADEYRWSYYPNASYWPGRAMDVYFTKSWQWDRAKPLYMGEWGWFPGGRDQFAACIGPDVYRPGMTYGGAKAVLWGMGIEGMRYYGVSAICPWTALEGARFERITQDRPQHRAVREGFTKLKVAIRERGSVYFAGQEIKRTVSAYNDTLQPRQLQVRWRLLIGEKTVESGEWTELVAPAGVSRETVTVRLPGGLARTADGRFAVELFTDGRQVPSAESRFRVFPRLTDTHNASLAAIGLRETHLNALKRLGADVRSVTMQDVPALRVPLVIGPQAELAADDSKLLREFVEGGGQVVVLATERGPRWRPAGTDLEWGAITRFFITWPGSRLLAGLTESDFSFWPEDNVVTHTAWRRPAGVACRPVVSGGVGLDFSPLAELRLGAGRAWLVSLPIWTSTPANPVTDRIGRNLLDDLREYEPRTARPLGLLAPPYSSTEALLADAGAGPVALAGKLDQTPLVDYACVLIEATPETMPEALAHAQALRDYVAAGGTVWLHHVRPETAEAAGKLLGREVELADIFDLPLTLLHRPLTAGMSEACMFWAVSNSDFTAARPDMVEHVVNVDGGHALTSPAALFDLPHGAGRFIIDQLGWDDEFHNRSRACEYVAGLCANLDVALVPLRAALPQVTFLAHFDGRKDADYAAGAPWATVTGESSFVDGKYGSAVIFGEGGQLAYQQRNNLDINTGAIELWYRGPADKDQMLFRTTPRAFNDPDFIALWIWQGMLRLDHHSLPGGPGSGYIVHPLQLSEGWHHIAATWHNGSGIALYVDGQQVAAREGVWERTEPRFRDFTLSASHRPLAGAIDEVRILNYQLTPDMVAADAAAGAPFTAPPGIPAAEWVPGMAPQQP